MLIVLPGERCGGAEGAGRARAEGAIIRPGDIPCQESVISGPRRRRRPQRRETMTTSSGLEDRFLTLHELARAAKQNLAVGAWDYMAGGAETETTLRRNRQAIDSVAFRPRVLRNVSRVDVSSTLLGRPVRLPVMLAPVGSIESFT